MSKIVGSIEEDVRPSIAAPTLVRRVSNMLKDGNKSGPPMLFRHPSMQKIRHCCQNLNLFPYLLYSVDNSKSHPIARKVNLCISQLLRGITERIFFLYESLRETVLRSIRGEKKTVRASDYDDGTDIAKPSTKFRNFEKRKRKQSPFLLTVAVYFAPLVLAFQLLGLCSLMIFGKYTPGFIFLITALLFLGCIKLKILFHSSSTHNCVASCEKKKVH